MNPFGLAKYIRNHIHCAIYHPEVCNWYKNAEAEHYARQLEVYLQDNLTVADLNVLIARLNCAKMSRKAWKRLDRVILPKLERMLRNTIEMNYEGEQEEKKLQKIRQLERGGQL